MLAFSLKEKSSAALGLQKASDHCGWWGDAPMGTFVGPKGRQPKAHPCQQLSPTGPAPQIPGLCARLHWLLTRFQCAGSVQKEAQEVCSQTSVSLTLCLSLCCLHRSFPQHPVYVFSSVMADCLCMWIFVCASVCQHRGHVCWACGHSLCACLSHSLGSVLPVTLSLDVPVFAPESPAPAPVSAWLCVTPTHQLSA